MKEALLYSQGQDNSVDCYLCQHRCHINEGKTGVCGVRQNQKGTLYSLNYGAIVGEQNDPIEKKPLFHFLPGSFSYSIALVGCNFQCDFCQNWQISQKVQADALGIVGSKKTVTQIVDAAVQQHCKSIAYTYTEPTIFFEFAYECAVLAKEKGLANVFVTNGYMTCEAVEYIRPVLDAANIDLKAMSDSFYQQRCKARLQPVLDTITLMKRKGIWIEVTTLIIPGQNDSNEELKSIAQFLASVDRDIPWHISCFHPDYKLVSIPPTPQATLDRAYDIGKQAGLRYIYVGNIYTDYGEHTYCPQCSRPIVKRVGFSVQENYIKNGMCQFCQCAIAGVWR